MKTKMIMCALRFHLNTNNAKDIFHLFVFLTFHYVLLPYLGSSSTGAPPNRAIPPTERGGSTQSDSVSSKASNWGGL